MGFLMKVVTKYTESMRWRLRKLYLIEEFGDKKYISKRSLEVFKHSWQIGENWPRSIATTIFSSSSRQYWFRQYKSDTLTLCLHAVKLADKILETAGILTCKHFSFMKLMNRDLNKFKFKFRFKKISISQIISNVPNNNMKGYVGSKDSEKGQRVHHPALMATNIVPHSPCLFFIIDKNIPTGHWCRNQHHTMTKITKTDR